MVSGVLNKSGEVRVVRLKPRRRQTAGLSVHCAEGETKGSERSPSPGVAGGAWMLQSLEVSQAARRGRQALPIMQCPGGAQAGTEELGQGRRTAGFIACCSLGTRHKRETKSWKEPHSESQS